MGTLGRSILEGATKVRLFGEEIEICADIKTLPGISGHADNRGLMKWMQKNLDLRMSAAGRKKCL